MSGSAPAVDPSGIVRFGDVHGVLALVAQGLTGRHLQLTVRAAQAVPGRLRRLATDSVSISLPAAIADFEEARHNAGAYRIAALHQIGYLQYGSVGFSLATAAERMKLPTKTASDTGGAVRLTPARRRTDLERFFAAWPRPALMRRLFAILEDLRIDCALRRDYPGARTDLARVLAYALATRPRIATLRALPALVETLVRYSLGATRSDLLAMDTSGLADDLLAIAATVEVESADVYDSASAAHGIAALLESLLSRRSRGTGYAAGEAPLLPAESGPDAQAGAGDEAGTDGDGDGDGEDFEGAGVEFRGDFLPDLVYRRIAGGETGTLPQDALQAALPTPSGDEDMDTGATPGAPLGTERNDTPHEPRTFLYDEWDYRSTTYLKAWCRVVEQRLRGEDTGFIEAVRRRHTRLAREVKRRFSRVKPQSWVRIHRVSDGEELDIDSVIETVIDRRVGIAADDDWYVRRDRAQRDVAAAFLIDMSASTDFPIPDPDAKPAPAPAPSEHDQYLWGRYGGPVDTPPPAAKRRVIDVEKEAMALMGDALQTLGDRYAIYGFSGSGRDNVEFHVAKDFADPVSARTWAALSAMAPRGSTRMGPAIRHAVRKLRREPMRTKVLIIVSDGYPEDQDYGPDRRDDEYGIKDTARALSEAAHAGISTFCITIDPAGHDYLRRMCSPNRYLVIDEVDALPEELSKIYRTLTGAA